MSTERGMVKFGLIPTSPTTDHGPAGSLGRYLCLPAFTERPTMKLLLEKPSDHAVTLFRRAGYAFQREEAGETSFVRPLARAGFPRFHCYTKQTAAGLECNLHLDQKRETYGKDTRHHGEYENEGAVREERERLERLFGTLTLLA